MSTYQAHVAAKLKVEGTFEFRDADGNVVGTVQLSGGLPLASPDEVEAARNIIDEQGNANGQLRE